MDNKWFLLGALLLFGTIVISAGGLGEILGGATATTEKVDLQLDSKTKETLSSLSSVSETKCIEYECVKMSEGKCEKLDEKTGECLVWIEEPKCLEYSEKCVKEEVTTTPIGIETVTITPKGNNCYDLVSEPMLHRYNTCIPAGTSVMDYVKKDLEMIAEHTKNEKTKGIPIDENIIEVTIK